MTWSRRPPPVQSVRNQRGSGRRSGAMTHHRHLFVVRQVVPAGHAGTHREITPGRSCRAHRGLFGASAVVSTHSERAPHVPYRARIGTSMLRDPHDVANILASWAFSARSIFNRHRYFT